MKTKQRITSLFLALVIAFAMMPTSAMAAKTTTSNTEKTLMFEVAWSMPVHDNTTLVFSQKPIRAQWGIADGLGRIAFVFPMNTLVSRLDENGKLIEFWGANESRFDVNLDANDESRLVRAYQNTGNTSMLILGEFLGMDPNGVRIRSSENGADLSLVMVDGKTERAVNPGDSIVHAWELDPTIPVPDGAEVNFDTFLTPSFAIRSDDPSIISLAEKITEGLVGDLAKARAIHHWVAKNIWYDHDTCDIIMSSDDVKTSKASESRSQISTDVLSSKLAVCEGYANLTVALLRATGIPAETVSSEGDVDNGILGHMWLNAYVDGRWINMDPTWDSVNSYHYGKFSRQHEPANKWFDVPDDVFDLTHIDKFDIDGLYQFILNEGLAATEIWPDGSTEQPNDGIAA